MKAGDILLFKVEKDWGSRLIAWGTNSLYAHAAICVSAEMNLAIEAMTRGGVRARDTRQIKQEYDAYRVKAGSRYDLNETISYLVSKLNCNYDVLGVIFLGILKVLAKLYFPVKTAANRWQKEKDYFCSELCYEAFALGGGLDIVPQIPHIIYFFLASVIKPKNLPERRFMDSRFPRFRGDGNDSLLQEERYIAVA